MAKEAATEKGQSPVKGSSKERVIDVVFRLDYAPQGKGKTTFDYMWKDEKKRTTIEIDNGVVIIKSNQGNYAELRSALLSNGFKDVTRGHGGVIVPQKKIDYEFRVVHPDHTSDEPKNGKTAVDVGDKKVNLEIVNGLVTTRDIEVYKALLRAKYVAYDKTPIGE